MRRGVLWVYLLLAQKQKDAPRVSPGSLGDEGVYKRGALKDWNRVLRLVVVYLYRDHKGMLSVLIPTHVPPTLFVPFKECKVCLGFPAELSQPLSVAAGV